MSIRNLEHFFRPRSVAVIGASEKPRSVGATVLHNLVEGGFAGPIMPVNPKHDVLAGIKVYPTVASLPAIPELAVICTPPATVPDLIDELGARGTKAAIVITAGLEAVKDGHGKTLKEAMLAASKPYLLRILGPNCVGLLVSRPRAQCELRAHRRLAWKNCVRFTIGRSGNGCSGLGKVPEYRLLEVHFLGR
jgi:acetyltransferase